ncbi:MAG: hypothetical protein NTV34_20180 [Proteobacteria bacterium]|nr:hypothetical protein [Pseudomonadota bacterium]
MSLSNGCGTIAGNPTKPGAGGGATSKFISDSTLGSSLVSSHVDDAIDAVGEDALSASSVSFALVDQSSNLDVAPKIQLSAQSEYIRSCEVVGATVVSSRSFNGERSDTFTRFGRQFTKSLSGTDSTKVTWSKAGSNLKCSGADSKVAGIDFLQSKDLTQESTIDRSWVATLTNNTSNTVVQKRQHNLSGTRKSTWAASAFAGGLTTVQRSSIWEVSKEDVLVSRSGESTTTKTTLKVDAAIPMITEITWNSGGPSSWKERTINQGSIINDQDDNSRITLPFDQLKFQKATGLVILKVRFTIKQSMRIRP